MLSSLTKKLSRLLQASSSKPPESLARTPKLDDGSTTPGKKGEDETKIGPQAEGQRDFEQPLVLTKPVEKKDELDSITARNIERALGEVSSPRETPTPMLLERPDRADDQGVVPLGSDTKSDSETEFGSQPDGQRDYDRRAILAERNKRSDQITALNIERELERISPRSATPVKPRTHAPSQVEVRPPAPDETNADTVTTGDGQPTPEAHVKSTINSTKIKDFVATAMSSVRLRNAIAGAETLPVETIGDYMLCPEASLEAIRRLVKNFGKKSARELHELITIFYEEELVSAMTDSRGATMESSHSHEILAEKAKAAARNVLVGLQFPDDVLDNNPPVRLSNILKRSHGAASIPFSEFLECYDQTVRNLRSERNCGATTIAALDQQASEIIIARLEALSVDQRLAISIRRVLEQKSVEEDALRSVAELNDFDVSIMGDQQGLSQLGVTTTEIVSRALEELSERELDIVSRRYALAGGAPETLQEISEGYNVTRERIRQLEAKALKKVSNRKTTNALAAALEAEDVIEKLFTDRRIVTVDQMPIAANSLTALEILAIDICYGGVKEFLEKESVRTEAGWVLEQHLLEMPVEPEVLAGSLRHRMIDAILDERLPIRVSQVAKNLPDYSLDVIKSELVSCFEAELDGDEVRAAPRLPAAARYILILRKTGHALHCKEVRALNHEIFGKDDSIQQIGNVLGGLEEALIVARGTYDLYENLRLTSDDLLIIRDTVYEHLLTKSEFISVKVIFSDIFQGTTEQYGPDFDYYMLLGILQDDERFDVRRGLMVGLDGEGDGDGFRSLKDEIIAVLSEAGHALSLEDIAEALEGRRDTFLTSIATSLDNASEAVSVGRGHYDLTSRIFGDSERQGRLASCCLIVLASGPKSALALCEAVAPIFGEFHTRPLKSFLAAHCLFETTGDLISVRELPDRIDAYIKRRNDALLEIEQSAGDLESVKELLEKSGFKGLTSLDPTLSSFEQFEDESTNDAGMLDKLLGDFGV